MSVLVLLVSYISSRMEETILKRVLSTPTKPSPKRVASFASPKKASGIPLSDVTRNTVHNSSNLHISTEAIGIATAQVSTAENDNRQYAAAQYEPHSALKVGGIKEDTNFSVPLDF